MLGATLLGGLTINFALRNYPNSLIASIAITAAAVVLFASGSLESKASKVLVGLAPAFGFWLTIRASAPLVAFDLIAALGLLVLGAALSKRGRFFDYRLSWMLQAAANAIEDGLMAGPYGARSITQLSSGRNRETIQQALVGFAIATPILLLVGVLLTQADSEFASIFGWLGTTGIIGHLALIAIGALAILTLLRSAHAGRDDLSVPGAQFLAPTTSLVVILGFVGLYGLFVGTQVVDILQTTFTQTEIRDYARSGFFQLLAVAVITLLTLMLVPAITKPADAANQRRLRVASVVAIGLTLVITMMSVRRLLLFVEIDELTMLRTMSIVAALTIGVLFVLLAAKLWGLGANTDWFVGASIATVLVVVFALNVANPEAIVAKYNTGSIDKIETIDMYYLGQLSADAVPSLLDALDDLPEQQANELGSALCYRHSGDDRSGLGYNRATVAAEGALRTLCSD